VYAHDVARVPSIISVDSDRHWIGLVQSSLSEGGGQAFLEHCDIGRVGRWGLPTSHAGISRYWRYMATPWDAAKRHGLVPDTILIDGRFRVASFLYSLVSAREGAVILFDDYHNRPHYAAIERFSKPIESHGRMAVFSAAKGFSVDEISRAIAEFSVDPR